MNILFNTKGKGVFHFLYYKLPRGIDYVGICLNLNIIEYDQDIEKLQKSLEEAAFSYLEAVRQGNFPDEDLNVLAPNKYWQKYSAETKRIEKIEKIIKDATPHDSQLHRNLDYFSFTQRPYMN